MAISPSTPQISKARAASWNRFHPGTSVPSSSVIIKFGWAGSQTRRRIPCTNLLPHSIISPKLQGDVLGYVDAKWRCPFVSARANHYPLFLTYTVRRTGPGRTLRGAMEGCICEPDIVWDVFNLPPRDISKSWKVCYSLAAPGDQAASLTRAWNELYGLITGYKSLLAPRIITIITRYN